MAVVLALLLCLLRGVTRQSLLYQVVFGSYFTLFRTSFNLF